MGAIRSTGSSKVMLEFKSHASNKNMLYDIVSFRDFELAAVVLLELAWRAICKMRNYSKME